MWVWLTFCLLIFTLQVLTILIIEFRHPAKAVSWLFVLFVVPVIGFVVYYFLAKEFQKRRILRDRENQLSNEVEDIMRTRTMIVHTPEDIANSDIHIQERLLSLLTSFGDSPITTRNETRVLTNGRETFDTIFEEIRKATHHIHIEYYTIRNDEIGLELQSLLIAKAKEGVKIRIIYDGIGSYELGDDYLNPLHDVGVESKSYLPAWFAFFNRRMNYRNHRKIIVIDGKVGFLGGINVGDEYLGKHKTLGFWRDTHLMVRGDSVYFLQNIFLTDWYFVSKTKITDIEYFPIHHCEGSKQIQIVASGPDSAWDSILEIYFGAISTATKRIFITKPYFVPDPSLYMALKTAALSGLDVRVILPGKPDHKVVFWASLSYLNELLQVGVRFYQYQKGFVHAKVIIADDILASVGTANVDMRSFQYNFEVNAVVFDKQTIQRLETDFYQDLKESKEVIFEEFDKRSPFLKAREVLSRLLSPLL